MYHYVRVHVLALCLAVIACGAQSKAQDRYALIVGADHYRTREYWLPNPNIDVNKIAQGLYGRGYKVWVLFNFDNDQTRSGVEAYVNTVKASTKPAVALMFFAGHGVQVDGHNYILLSDVPQLSTADDVRQHGIDVGGLLTDVARSGASAIGIFVDACRNNPFADSAPSSGRGLAPMRADEYSDRLDRSTTLNGDIPAGTAISFSTQPGETAEDGPRGQGSPYSSAIVEILTEMPNITFTQLFVEVERRVLSKTNGTQRPWVSSKIARDAPVFAR